MKIQHHLTLALFSIILSGCGDSSSNSDDKDSSGNPSSSSYAIVECDSLGENEFCDQRFGQKYKFVTYGTQVWMAENLNSGVMVPGMESADHQSDDSKLEKYCYNDSTALCKVSGGFYQWYEAVGLSAGCIETHGEKGNKCPTILPSSGNVQGACPFGWHIPRESEWLAMVTFLGAKDGSASPVGSKVKLFTGEHEAQRWDDGLNNDSNSSGFSAYPAGYRGPSGYYYNMFHSATFWSIGYSNEPFTRGLGENETFFFGNMGDPSYGHTIRCVRDEPEDAPSSSSSIGISYGKITDKRDNQSYKTIQIGKQTWFAQNLNYEAPSGISKCFEGSDQNCKIYGRLYSWSTAMGVDAAYDSTQWVGDSSNWQGICPTGWKIPSLEDWLALQTFADRSGDGALNRNAGMALKSDSLWSSQFGSGHSEWSIGFAGLPAGYGLVESPTDIMYECLGECTAWWSTEQDIVNSYGIMHDGKKSILTFALSLGDDQLMLDEANKSSIYSVRCIKAK